MRLQNGLIDPNQYELEWATRTVACARCQAAITTATKYCPDCGGRPQSCAACDGTGCDACHGTGYCFPRGRRTGTLATHGLGDHGYRMRRDGDRWVVEYFHRGGGGRAEQFDNREEAAAHWEFYGQRGCYVILENDDGTTYIPNNLPATNEDFYAVRWRGGSSSAASGLWEPRVRRWVVFAAKWGCQADGERLGDFADRLDAKEYARKLCDRNNRKLLVYDVGRHRPHIAYIYDPKVEWKVKHP